MRLTPFSFCSPRSWIERLFPGLYPRYLHVLRVDPDKMDAVRQGQAGAGAAPAGSNPGWQHEVSLNRCLRLEPQSTLKTAQSRKKAASHL